MSRTVYPPSERSRPKPLAQLPHQSWGNSFISKVNQVSVSDKRTHEELLESYLISLLIQNKNLTESFEKVKPILKDLEFIEKMPHINWTLVIRKVLKAKLDEISSIKKIVAKSKLSEEDVDELTNTINEDLSKNYR